MESKFTKKTQEEIIRNARGGHSLDVLAGLSGLTRTTLNR